MYSHSFMRYPSYTSVCGPHYSYMRKHTFSELGKWGVKTNATFRHCEICGIVVPILEKLPVSQFFIFLLFFNSLFIITKNCNTPLLVLSIHLSRQQSFPSIRNISVSNQPWNTGNQKIKLVLKKVRIALLFSPLKEKGKALAIEIYIG